MSYYCPHGVAVYIECVKCAHPDLAAELEAARAEIAALKAKVYKRNGEVRDAWVERDAAMERIRVIEERHTMSMADEKYLRDSRQCVANDVLMLMNQIKFIAGQRDAAIAALEFARNDFADIVNWVRGERNKDIGFLASREVDIIDATLAKLKGGAK